MKKKKMCKINKKSFDEFLPFVDNPSRYLGSEINSIKKDASDTDIKVALAFPDLYEIGTSHVGIQILYTILNSKKNMAAERVFAPDIDMAEKLKSYNIPLTSLETGTPLTNFDVIGFSLLYELNYTNIILMLDLAKIPFLSSQRDISFPLVIAGGPCTCNPEPVAELFDAMVVGDGEDVIIKICNAYIEWKKSKDKDKEALLKTLSKIEGVYIPSFFNLSSSPEGFQVTCSKYTDYKAVTRTIIEDLDQAIFPEAPVIPYGKPVHDRLRIEISRGCSRGCRFCQAGMIYRPVRERSLTSLINIVDKSLKATGYGELSLLSLSTGDYSSIVPLMESLMSKQRNHPVAVSFPSIRAETLTYELMNLVKSVRKTGFTIAPEAGTQRLRDVINKNISEKEIFETVNNTLALGWQVIKLYFMVGLPTETDEDVKGIADLVKNLRKANKTKHTRYQINVSVATFIPKSHTPFQWAKQISLNKSKEKIAFLKSELNVSGVNFKWQAPETSLFEGLFARGDRRLNRLLINAYKNTCRFDGWSSHFCLDSWQQSLTETDIDMDFYTIRTRDLKELLPWDHINTKIKKDFLQKEWEKATSGDLTKDCRTGDCSACGVCDFKIIRPNIKKYDDKEMFKPFMLKNRNVNEYKKLKLTYTKKDRAKYFGHLELANIFFRAIRRSDILLKYSEGFHPKPKISFNDPLPIGIESLNEEMVLTVPKHVLPDKVIHELNTKLPEGIIINRCEEVLSKESLNKIKTTEYVITLNNGSFDEKLLEEFRKADKYFISIVNQKGKIKEINLKEKISELKLQAPDIARLSIISDKEKTIRPGIVLEHIFGMTKDQIKLGEIIKL